MNEKMRILIVEDEEIVRLSLAENLSLEGYKVTAVGDGEEAVRVFSESRPDLVVLDLVLPKLDGLDVLKQIKAINALTPVIILTARAEEVDKIVGLEVGADDYLTKPFSMRELFARIKSLFRRVQTMAEAQSGVGGAHGAGGVEQVEIGGVKIDFKTYRAWKNGEEMDFSVKEFELLKYLVSRPDVPVSRNDLLDEVWGYNNYPTTRTVDNFIARLRHKMEEVPDKPRYIITVHGIGYKYVP